MNHVMVAIKYSEIFLESVHLEWTPAKCQLEQT